MSQKSSTRIDQVKSRKKNEKCCSIKPKVEVLKVAFEPKIRSGFQFVSFKSRKKNIA